MFRFSAATLLSALSLGVAGCSIFGSIDADAYRVGEADGGGGALPGGGGADAGGTGGSELAAGAGGAASSSSGGGSCPGIRLPIDSNEDDAQFHGGMFDQECISGCQGTGQYPVSGPDSVGFRFSPGPISVSTPIRRAGLYLHLANFFVGPGSVEVSAWLPEAAPFSDGHYHEPEEHALGFDFVELGTSSATQEPTLIVVDVTEAVRRIVASSGYEPNSTHFSLHLGGGQLAAAAPVVLDSSAGGQTELEIEMVCE